ncbi:MAG TPA: hypothetical protein VGM92_12030 [Candidatus Kapabacteria bacterium]|jgi:hypothetical protein
MNRHKFFLAAFLITVSLAACKSNTGPSDNGGFPVVMTALVNDTSWSGIIPFIGYTNGYLDFSAGDSNSSIAIYYTQTDTGSYPVNGNTGDDLFATYDRNIEVMDSITKKDTLSYNHYVSYGNSGMVHFTHLDTSLAIGTFSFKAVNANSPYDTITITDGAFDISL